MLNHFGPQGWWPLISMKNKPGFDKQGYHPKLYDYPKTENQRFEIIMGAILTQNTSWKNVEKALGLLEDKKLLTLKAK